MKRDSQRETSLKKQKESGNINTTKSGNLG